MPAEGWFDDGSGRERWWDGERWTDRFRDAETASVPAEGPVPLRVFAGSGGGSVSLAVHPTYIEYEHKNYFVTIPLAKLGPLSYSKEAESPYNAVTLMTDVKFYAADPREVYEYLRDHLAGQ